VNRQSTIATSSDGVVRLAMLVACASVLQVAESLLPHPLPGVRLGLANIIAVMTMVCIGPGSAIQLAVLRTLVSSMVLGTLPFLLAPLDAGSMWPLRYVAPGFAYLLMGAGFLMAATFGLVLVLDLINLWRGKKPLLKPA